MRFNSNSHNLEVHFLNIMNKNIIHTAECRYNKSYYFLNLQIKVSSAGTNFFFNNYYLYYINLLIILKQMYLIH